MKETMDWLIKLEHMAAELYEAAAKSFANDPGLFELLTEMGRDEREHHAAMCRAKAVLLNEPEPQLDISVDHETRQWVERPLLECADKLGRGTLTRDELLGYMAEIEFSELNHIFLYAMNAMKGRAKSETWAHMETEAHKDRFKNFIAAEPGAEGLLKLIERLPRVASESILIVDDDPGILNLLKSLLEKDRDVQTASNGSDAFTKLATKYFSAIITDVDMPVMSGLELYSKAAARFPAIRRRFLFFTGAADSERIAFFRQNNLNYLIKPASIKAIKSSVAGILSSKDAPPPGA